MRTYPCNSPQAAARIVALAMLADGKVSDRELDVLDRSGAHQQLGLQPDDWDAAFHGVCDDLLEAARSTCSDECLIDPRMLAGVLAEIVDPALRLKVLRLCVSVVEADGQVDKGMAIMLGTTMRQWGLHQEMLQPDVASVHEWAAWSRQHV